MDEFDGLPGLGSLSEQQRSFAARVGGTRAVRCAHGVACVYRAINGGTIRWIVASDGVLLDWSVFDGC